MEEKETERQKGKQRDKSSKRNKSQMASIIRRNAATRKGTCKQKEQAY
jgi:hypothetical protein